MKAKACKYKLCVNYKRGAKQYCCVGCRFDDADYQQTKVFDVKQVEKTYNKLRPVWEPLARKAVDHEFKQVARDARIVGWKPIRFSKTYMRRIVDRDATAELREQVLDTLEADFWESDAGLDTIDVAYERMAKATKMTPDAELDVVGDCNKFSTAWNHYQNSYAKKMYGVDIMFGN